MVKNYIRYPLIFLIPPYSLSLFSVRISQIHFVHVFFRYKNGREIPSNDANFEICYSEAEASLTILKTSNEDSGNYLVSAKNKIGSCDSECNVTIHGND